MADGRKLIEITQIKGEIDEVWQKLQGYKNNDEASFPVKSNRQKQRIIQVIHFIRAKGKSCVDLDDVPKRPFNNVEDLKIAKLRLQTFETESCISAFKALRNGLQVLKDIVRFSRKPPKSLEYNLSKSSVIEFHSMLVTFITNMEKKCAILQTQVEFYPLFNKVTNWKDALENIQKDDMPIVIGENNLSVMYLNRLESFIPLILDFELRNHTRLLVYRCRVLCDFLECLETNSRDNRVSEFDLQAFYLLDNTTIQKRKEHKTVEKVASNNSSYIEEDRMVVNSESRTTKEAVKTAYDVLSMEGGDEYYYSSANVSRNNSYVPVTPKKGRKGRRSTNYDNSISEPEISIMESSILERSAPVFLQTEEEVKPIVSPPSTNNHRAKKYTKKKRSSRSSDNSETSRRQSDQESNVSVGEQILKLNSLNTKSPNFEQVNGVIGVSHDKLIEPRTPDQLAEDLKAYSSSGTSTPSELELTENEKTSNNVHTEPKEDMNNNKDESLDNVKTLIHKFSSPKANTSPVLNGHPPSPDKKRYKKSSSVSEAPNQSTPTIIVKNESEARVLVTPIPIPRPRSRDSISDMKPATLPRMKKSENSNYNNNKPLIKESTVFSPHPNKIPKPAPRIVTGTIDFDVSCDDDVLLSSESSDSDSGKAVVIMKAEPADVPKKLNISKTDFKNSQNLKNSAQSKSDDSKEEIMLELSTEGLDTTSTRIATTENLQSVSAKTAKTSKAKSVPKPSLEKSNTKIKTKKETKAMEKITLETKEVLNDKPQSTQKLDGENKTNLKPNLNLKIPQKADLAEIEKKILHAKLSLEKLKNSKVETNKFKQTAVKTSPKLDTSVKPPQQSTDEAVEFKIEFDEIINKESRGPSDVTHVEEDVQKSSSEEEEYKFSNESDSGSDKMRILHVISPPSHIISPPSQVNIPTSTAEEFDIDFSLSEYETPIVVDNGSGFCKAGFADDNVPRVVCPTYVGRPRYQTQFTLASTKPDKSYIGDRANGRRGVLNLSYPIEHGIVTNWDDMEAVWHHVFDNELRVEVEDHPVMLTEAALNPKANRERIMQIMFEQFQVPAMYLAVQAVLALYGTGMTTGLVLDSGDGVTHVVPVYEGCALQHGVQRYDVAGRDITEHFSQLLQQNGHSFVSTAEMEIVRDIKEKLCYVALDYEAEDKKRPTAIEKTYIMPDGQEIIVDKPRFQCPEVLFDPSILGKVETDGLHHLVHRATKTCDSDLTEQFLSTILLSGGTTMFPGLSERLTKELTPLVSNLHRNKIRVNSPANRKSLVWTGGAILARSSFFERYWISSYEYDECGPSLIHRRAF